LSYCFPFREVFLQIFFAAAFEFAADFAAFIWRAVAAVCDASECKNCLLACIACVFLGGVTGGLGLTRDLARFRILPAAKLDSRNCPELQGRTS